MRIKFSFSFLFFFLFFFSFSRCRRRAGLKCETKVAGHEYERSTLRVARKRFSRRADPRRRGFAMKFNSLYIAGRRKLVTSRDGNNDDALLFLAFAARRTGSTPIRTDQEVGRVILEAVTPRESLAVDLSDPN